MSGTCRRCYCSCGLAQDMKHCCWVGLLLGYYSTAWPLSPNYSKRQQCCVTDWTTFHCKYRTDRAKARPQKCCHVCYYQGIRNGKKPDSLSLPHCCPSQPSLPYHKKLCYCRHHATCCVSWNLVNYCTTVWTSCTTNQSNRVRASHQQMCNKLYVSIHYTSTVVGVVNKLDCWRVWLISLPWWNFSGLEFGTKFWKEVYLDLWKYRNFHTTQRKIGRRKPPCWNHLRLLL